MPAACAFKGVVVNVYQSAKIDTGPRSDESRAVREAAILAQIRNNAG